ncbi:calcium-dependent phosphotriesterase [Pluteus cervinus]|uniref:Calcium-dependent phosphotriesterase n=1 Tax=Pluteus cervinus TaxID=181527 RepID=A0ACD3B3K4_9AGAR|nr:calcium-dependent phosphotriesterase [Pluteus cervinus]
MPTFRPLTFVSVLVAWLIYKNGLSVKNSILIKSPLPEGYYYGGNFTTQCTNLPNPADSDDLVKYCEDVTFWDLHDQSGKLSERRVILSCDPGRKQWNTVMGPLRDPEPLGTLFWYAPKYTKENVRRIAPDSVKPEKIVFKGYPEGHTFHPLGVDIYPSFGGNASNLYVVNHAKERTVIEQFVLSPNKPVATYIRTLSSPYFVAPNSLALTSPDSFYVTNDHLITRRWPIIGHFVPLLESLLALPLAFVLHITLNPPSSSKDAIQSLQIVEKLMPFPNGVSVSPSGKEVAIVSTTMNSAFIYNRDLTTNLLELKSQVQVPFSADNILYDDDSNLILAGHPNFPQLTKVVADEKDQVVAPSWVVEISPRKEAINVKTYQEDTLAPVSVHSKVSPSPDYAVKTLFQSDGSVFSTSCTGMRDTVSSVFYISGLYADPGVMVCRPQL